MFFVVDNEARIVRVDLAHIKSARAMTDYILTIAAERPEICAWDWIMDARRAVDDVSNDHVNELAQAQPPLPKMSAMTVFLSSDPNLQLWSMVMDARFPGRRHVVAETDEAAVALIAEARAQR